MLGRNRAGVATLLLALIVCPLRGAEPEIRNLNVRGLQVKGTTTLTIDGDNFGTNPRLLLPFPANASLKPGGNDKQATFDVALDEDLTPGYHQLRIVSESGVSSPVVVAVDRLAQRPFGSSIEHIPVALHGNVAGSVVVETTFNGKTGQRVMVEVEAKRLGSALRPVVHLYDAKRLQLAWAWGVTSLHGDARLETTLPADGTYRITLHDAEYQAPANSFFRLRVGQWSYVDRVFPPVAGKDTNTAELIGSGSLKADLPANRNAPWLPLLWPKDGVWSGPRPFIETSARVELIEQPASGKPQELPPGAVAVSGKLSTPGEEDRYRLPVTAGSKVKLEVFADRIGSDIDVSLVVRNEAGVELARVEDSPRSLDPLLDYTVPANVSAIVVGVVDGQGRDGPRGIYRLVVDPANTPPPNEFDLFTSARRITLPGEGKVVVPVLVERRGYLGPIDLSTASLPTGVKLEGTQIAAGTDGTLVTVIADGGTITPSLMTWQGRTADGRDRLVLQKNHPLEKIQPWLATEMAIAGSAAKGKDLLVEWLVTKDDDALVLGRRLALKIKVTRDGGQVDDPSDGTFGRLAVKAKATRTPAAPIRVTLLTSQAPVLLNNQPDPNRTIRLERAIELAANVVESEIPLLIPVDLSADTFDIALQAESLTANKQGVTATAFTPVRRLPVRWPIALKLDGKDRIDVKADAKLPATLEIVGTVTRLPGIDGDVQISLTGVPAGVQAPPVTVKAGTNPFKVKVTFPANIAIGEIKGLKLNGSIVPEPKQPNQRVKSKDIDVTFNVIKGMEEPKKK